MDSTAATSTLTRQRLSLAVLSLAATATLGYLCYRIYNPPLSEPPPDRRLHRSNAVRHRRRSIPTAHRGHERQSSEASTTSGESHADENGHVNAGRPLTDAETVVLDDNWYDDDNNNQYNQQQQRAGQNIVSLLFRVSEDNARRNAYVHRGCRCNGCGVLPIRGIRYRCANCADFDLCEICESQGLHTKTHVFYKIKIPAPRVGARQLQPVWYPGDPENCMRLLPKSLMTRLSKETGFERPELEALWEQWTFMANTEWREDPDELGLAMDRKTFERYLVPSGSYRHMVPNLLHDRMFAFYDDNNDDLIGFSEFLRGTAYRKRKDRLRKVFSGYDADGDGYVNRRDFLRLFRAYYVLFKQMHEDMIEGQEDQVLSSTEAEQLVTSRQPLSSMFGREGGFTHADTDRPMQGKVVNLSTGEAHISDGGSRVVNEDVPDTADRQSILASVLTKQAEVTDSLLLPVMDDSQSIRDATSGIEYLSGLLNPPTRVSQLPALLLGETRDGDDFLVVVNGASGQEGSSDEQDTRGGDENSSRLEENGASTSGEDRAATRLATNGSSDGGEVRPDDRESRRASYRIRPGRRRRINPRRKLFDRWRRRQFYLDEEEGALPPEDWSDEDDILANLHDGSKAPQPPLLPRSRSSSKVRFAEDTDDFDIRSNPSTSSRSVPERWGGMEIPDAERDVGKEIFYQVIQQAFNEILDTFFKAKEDLAVEAAETKELRDKYRSLFESIDPEEQKEPQTGSGSPRRSPKPPQEQSLLELLATSGYLVETRDTQAEGGVGGTLTDGTEEDGAGGASAEDDEPPPLIPDDALVEEPSYTESGFHRDPTMPQFRPNSLAALHGQVHAQSQPEATSAGAKDGAEKANASTPPSQPPTSSGPGKKSGTSSSPEPIDRSALVRWKRLDLAEEEAKARGGWGRLSYEEFERIYKAEEDSGHRVDYLGTWIDFCIPIV